MIEFEFNDIEAGVLSAFLLLSGVGLLGFALRERRRCRRMDRELDEILDRISEGVVVYDREMRLVRCNQRFREIYALTAPALVKGASLRNILTFGVRAGQWPEAEGCEEKWISARLKVQAEPHKEMMTQVGDDRWILVRNMATPAGGTIGVRADVTELVVAKREAEAKSTAFEEISHKLKAALNEITFHAHKDALTGLYNRRYFEEFVEQGARAADGLRDDAKIHVLHVDLDHFKFVNDTFGHAAGDEILRNLPKSCAARLVRMISRRAPAATSSCLSWRRSAPALNGWSSPMM